MAQVARRIDSLDLQIELASVTTHRELSAREVSTLRSDFMFRQEEVRMLLADVRLYEQIQIALRHRSLSCLIWHWQITWMPTEDWIRMLRGAQIELSEKTRANLIILELITKGLKE